MTQEGADLRDLHRRAVVNGVVSRSAEWKIEKGAPGRHQPIEGHAAQQRQVCEGQRQRRAWFSLACSRKATIAAANLRCLRSASSRFPSLFVLFVGHTVLVVPSSLRFFSFVVLLHIYSPPGVVLIDDRVLPWGYARAHTPTYTMPKPAIITYFRSIFDFAMTRVLPAY